VAGDTLRPPDESNNIAPTMSLSTSGRFASFIWKMTVRSPCFSRATTSGRCGSRYSLARRLKLSWTRPKPRYASGDSCMNSSTADPQRCAAQGRRSARNALTQLADGYRSFPWYLGEKRMPHSTNGKAAVMAMSCSGRTLLSAPSM
jgi:hypothetical protein